MALNAQEQADIIFFLGWPGNTIIPGSTSFSNIIFDRLNSLSTPMMVQVRAMLFRIKNLETKLDSAACRLAAKQVDGIILRDDEIIQLKKERRRALRELATLIDIELLAPSGVNVGVVI